VADDVDAGVRRDDVEGRQDLDPDKPLVYGQSVTDACMSWKSTVPVLDELAAAVRARRGTGSNARKAARS